MLMCCRCDLLFPSALLMIQIVSFSCYLITIACHIKYYWCFLYMKYISMMLCWRELLFYFLIMLHIPSCAIWHAWNRVEFSEIYSSPAARGKAATAATWSGGVGGKEHDDGTEGNVEVGRHPCHPRQSQELLDTSSQVTFACSPVRK